MKKLLFCLLLVSSLFAGWMYNPFTGTLSPVLPASAEIGISTVNVSYIDAKPKYTTGYATITTSALAVIGTDTTWLSSGVTDNDLIGFGVAPSTWYTVAHVTSNTLLGITSAYTGSPVVTGSYAVKDDSNVITSVANISMTGYTLTASTVTATTANITYLLATNLRANLNGTGYTITANKLTDGTASMTGGVIAGVTNLTATTANITNLLATNLKANLAAGTYAITAIGNIKSTGIVTANTFTDSTAKITAGAITGVTSLTCTTGNITNLVATNLKGNIAGGTYAITAIGNINSSGTVTANKLTDGTVTLTGGSLTGILTLSTGYTQTPVARIAGTAVTSTNAIIAAGTSMVTVTTNSADDFLVLPTPVAGHEITILPDTSAKGYEIRPVLQTQYINGTECTPNLELAIPAGDTVKCIALISGSAGKWAIYLLDDDGTYDSGGTPN